MFFFGIFGIQNKSKEINYIQNIICKSCGRMTTYKIVKTYNIFHFFFIPLLKWKEQYYAVSRCCSSIFKISYEKGKEIEKDILNINEDDLEYLYDNQQYTKSNICPRCTVEIKQDYIYCPYCGKKLK